MPPPPNRHHNHMAKVIPSLHINFGNINLAVYEDHFANSRTSPQAMSDRLPPTGRHVVMTVGGLGQTVPFVFSIRIPWEEEEDFRKINSAVNFTVADRVTNILLGARPRR